MEQRTLKDPVCGMTVTDKSFYQAQHQGQTRYFCGAKCRARFAAHGLRYVGGEAGEAVVAAHVVTQRRWPAHTGWAVWLAVLAALFLGVQWLYSQ